jgi:hypothetical protein
VVTAVDEDVEVDAKDDEVVDEVVVIVDGVVTTVRVVLELGVDEKTVVLLLPDVVLGLIVVFVDVLTLW